MNISIIDGDLLNNDWKKKSKEKRKRRNLNEKTFRDRGSGL